MLTTFRSSLDLKSLVQRAESLDYKTDDTGALMAYKQSCDAGLAVFEDAVSEIERAVGKTAHYVCVNKLPPGVSVPPHTDTLKGGIYERWHLPLVTNAGAGYYDKLNGEVMMVVGEWIGPIPYYLEHRVWNGGATDRVHLIVDLL